MRNESLAIYDVSPFVYIGNYVQGHYQNKLYGFPVKGIYYLLKYLSYDLAMNKDVILCFDSRSFRKDLMKKYKSHRVPNPEVFAQLDFLYDYLSKCGFSCLKESGYEADDLIFNCVEANKNKYREVIVYGVDYDLTHNVSQNVSFKSISSQVLSINHENFSKALVKGEVLEYNTITAYKVFMGDKSDKVSPFATKEYTSYQLYNLFLNTIKQAMPNVSPDIIKTKETMLAFIGALKPVLTEQEYNQLMVRLDVFYPAKIDKEIFNDVAHRYNINIKLYIELLSTLRDTKSLTSLGERSAGFSERIKEDLLSRGRALTTGEYAVDKNIVQNCVRMNSESLFIKEF